MSVNKVLYIGGFELPDKNAAAQRVVGIAKILRCLNFDVEFLNSSKLYAENELNISTVFGFKYYLYKRENDFDYLVSATTAKKMIDSIKPDVVIAYNYPSVSLYRIRKHCESCNIKCYADVSEWYWANEGSFIYQIIKNSDSLFRMTFVNKKMDGLIVISKFLYDYYRNENRVLIPPTVDIEEEKWKISMKPVQDKVRFVYAGSPSAKKENLDKIVDAIENMCDEFAIELNVVGITKDEYVEIYKEPRIFSDRIVFFGRLSHQETIEIVKECDWSIIVRDNNIVVKAGFPTKLVESISCMTPVICNQFSNVTDYLNDDNSIIIEGDICESIKKACIVKKFPDCTIFDYRRYVDVLAKLFL